MSTYNNNPFASKVTVTPGTSKAQSIYESIDDSNTICVRFIGGKTTRRLTKGSLDTSMAGVVRNFEGNTYPVSAEPIIGSIVSFKGAGQVSTYFEGEVVKGDYADVLGMSIAIHTTNEEYELINETMAKYEVNAVDVTFNVTPLNLWPSNDGSTKSKGYGQVEHIETKPLDITTSSVHIKDVNGAKMRAIEKQARVANSYKKSMAIKAGAQAPTLNLDLPRPVTTNVEG
jgi:hypothetical protein